MPKTTLETYKNRINAIRQKSRQNQPLTRDEEIDGIAQILTGLVIDQAPLQDVSTARRVFQCFPSKKFLSINVSLLQKIVLPFLGLYLLQRALYLFFCRKGRNAAGFSDTQAS